MSTTARIAKRKGGRTSLQTPGTDGTRVESGLVRISPSDAESGLVRILPIGQVRPSPENDDIYRPVDFTDPDFKALVISVRRHDIKEPLVITEDHYILSGHRRYAAARKAGLKTLPCRMEPVRRLKGGRVNPRFLEMLREFNRQRVKSLDEVMREEIVSADPEEAHRALVEHRKAASAVDLETITLNSFKPRSQISAAKRPFLEAVLQVLRDLKDFLPLSVRQIHYNLLNHPPLMHARKTGSRYANNMQSYKNLDDLLTRARIAGSIPFNAIHDPTRPVCVWTVFDSAGPFIRRELDQFLKGFYRNLQRSQHNHIEIIGEKNTVQGVIRPVAAQYCIPYTIGRGYSSLPPRHDMAERFRRSGKEKLVLLVLSDFDPEGEDIGRSFAQSMRDDFGVKRIEPVKVALTREQVDELHLPPIMQAKKTSSRYDRFTAKHGNDVYELEAAPPDRLQACLRAVIDTVLDVELFNAEIDAEKRDAAKLDGYRRALLAQLKDMSFEE